MPWWRDAHGLVLEEPAPTAQFSAFGDNALQFSLLYWFDANRTAREPLASDLHFMIDKAFAEARIVIAFPQHDIHFDDSKPLRVELSRVRERRQRTCRRLKRRASRMRSAASAHGSPVDSAGSRGDDIWMSVDRAVASA